MTDTPAQIEAVREAISFESAGYHGSPRGKQTAALNAVIVTLQKYERLEAALRWALPLAERALEDHRLQRLQAGHHDIGAGTSRIGLWPEEQDELRQARAALDASEEQS